MRIAFAGETLLALTICFGPLPRAHAVDIKVLGTGNMSSILAELGKEFERASGDNLAIEYGSTTRIKSRVEADEAADLIINERFVLEDLLHQAGIANGTLVDIARSPLAFGIRAGGVKRDVSTVEALKQTLLGTESIAQPDASGGAQDGTYFVNLIRYLGIADQMKPKIKLAMGGDAAAQAVASGAAQMGVAQRRNFNTLPGVQMLEPLPDLPGVKFLMVAGVLANAREPNAALAFAKFLASPSAVAVIKAKGMEPYAP
jgi:molybdate transport system substrate-binding protein